MILRFAVLVPSVRRWRNVPECLRYLHRLRKAKKPYMSLVGARGVEPLIMTIVQNVKIIKDLSAFSVVR
jgi:hypothetical protein